jgi:hypothetical protein
MTDTVSSTSDRPVNIHTCHAECPCQTGGQPRPDFIDSAPAKIVVATMEQTERSILRYLERYEREWGHKVWVRSWEMSGNRPPEEDPDFRVVLGRGMTQQALGRLVRAGHVEMRRDHGAGYRHYSITEQGRTLARENAGVFADA